MKKIIVTLILLSTIGIAQAFFVATAPLCIVDLVTRMPVCLKLYDNVLGGYDKLFYTNRVLLVVLYPFALLDENNNVVINVESLKEQEYTPEEIEKKQEALNNLIKRLATQSENGITVEKFAQEVQQDKELSDLQ